MTLTTFDEYDRAIRTKTTSSEADQFEAIFLLRQLYWSKTQVWKDEVKRLKELTKAKQFGWAELLAHKKADWGVTHGRFRSFNQGLEKLKKVIPASRDINEEARKCGVAVVALFGHVRWTQPMVAEGLRHVRSKEGINAKLTYQHVCKYIESQYPGAFARKKSKDRFLDLIQNLKKENALLKRDNADLRRKLEVIQKNNRAKRAQRNG